MQLHLQPLTLREANAFVRRHHRHHGEVRGCLFCVGVNDGAERALLLVAVQDHGRKAALKIVEDLTE